MSPFFGCVRAQVLCYWFSVFLRASGPLRLPKAGLRRLIGVIVSKHVIHQHLTNPYLTQTPSPAATPSLDFCVSPLMKSLMWCVCVCSHVWSRGAGVSPFESRGGLTVQDWTIFIYNRAEENRFVPDDIFIDWNMYCPPSHIKWLISGLVVAVLFLGGQGAMSTYVGLEMNSLFYPYMDFSILPQTEMKKWEIKKNISNITCLLFFCKMANKMWLTSRSNYASSSSFKCQRFKK